MKTFAIFGMNHELATPEKKKETSSPLRYVQKEKEPSRSMAFAKTDCTVVLQAHGSRKYEEKKNTPRTCNYMKKSGNPDPIHPRVDSVNRRQKLRDHH